MMSNTSNQYFLNLKINQIKMVQARGYDITNEEWILKESSGKEFYKKLYKKYGDYPIRKLMYSEYKKPNTKSLFIYFVGLQGGKQIKIESVRPFIEKMTEEDKNGILVIDSILSTEAAKCLSYVTESKYQIFKEEELKFDLMSSVSVPKHILVDNPAELKSKLAVSKNMCIILSTDPVAKYYHFVPGQIVNVVSESIYDVINNYSNDYCLIV